MASISFLNNYRFQGQGGAAAGALVVIEAEDSVFRGDGAHVQTAVDFLAEVEQHGTFLAMDLFAHDDLSFFQF
jgi:hypothetical protein